MDMALPVRTRNTDLTTFDPFRALADWESRMNEMFGAAFGTRPQSQSLWRPAVDIEETDTAYILEADLPGVKKDDVVVRSEEHTSELQSRGHLVCRLLLE